MNRIITALMVCAALTLSGCGGHSGHEHSEHGTEAHEGHEHPYHEGHNHDADEDGGDKEDHSGEIVMKPEQAQASGVKVETLQPSAFQSSLRVSGQLLAGQGAEQTVAATADGIVRFANPSIAEGTPVGAGQTLAVLSSKDLQNGDAVAKARAAYEAARADYERAGKLVADRIIAEKEYIQARAAYETARAAYEGVAKHATAQGTAVKAPATGYVKALLVRQGDYVSTGQPIAVVTQHRRLQLRADVPTSQMAMLPTVAGANFRQAGSDRVHRLADLHGRVLSYGRTVSDGAAFVPLTFELDNVGDIVAGAFAEVWVLAAPRHNVLAVPVEALTEESGVKYVYVQVEPDAYVKREVQTGQSDGRSVEITAGLKAGERIVTHGAVKVKMASMSAAIPAHNHNH